MTKPKKVDVWSELKNKTLAPTESFLCRCRQDVHETPEGLLEAAPSCSCLHISGQQPHLVLMEGIFTFISQTFAVSGT